MRKIEHGCATKGDRIRHYGFSKHGKREDTHTNTLMGWVKRGREGYVRVVSVTVCGVAVCGDG